MAGTSEKEQRTVMGLEAAVRVEAEFPTRPWRGTGVGEDPRGQGRATLAKEEGEGEEGFESEQKLILGGKAGRSRLLTAALGVSFLGVGWGPSVSCRL